MTDAVLHCKFCERPVDPYSTLTYRFVSGWERAHREGGGTNALRARKPHDDWACSSCVDKMSKGIDPSQSTLL